MAEASNLVARLRDTTAWSDELAEQAAAEIERLTAELKKFDPDPVVCGCREALCPHTPVALLPRQALVDHFKARIRELESRDG